MSLILWVWSDPDRGDTGGSHSEDHCPRIFQVPSKNPVYILWPLQAYFIATYLLLALSNFHIAKRRQYGKREQIWIPFMKFSLPPPGYAVPSATGPVSAAQLKQAMTLGQDLAAYTTYEVYPTFAVTARGDGYGAFWRYLSII
jgi:hypothetical protein